MTAVTVRDSARLAATEVYTAAWLRLTELAEDAEEEQRPLTAQILRRQAAKVHRAMLAEETDPEEPRNE